MNKVYFTMVCVAVLALVTFGVVTKNQENETDHVISNLEINEETYMSDITSTMDATAETVVEGVEELASDIEAEADEAYQTAVEDVLKAGEVVEIEPAAGDEIEITIEETVTQDVQ